MELSLCDQAQLVGILRAFFDAENERQEHVPELVLEMRNEGIVPRTRTIAMDLKV